jgi:hypothetical protein
MSMATGTSMSPLSARRVNLCCGGVAGTPSTMVVRGAGSIGAYGFFYAAFTGGGKAPDST